MQQVPAVCEL